MKRLVALILLIWSYSGVMAQTLDNPVTPKERAQKTTQERIKTLPLDAGQVDTIYKLNLKYAQNTQSEVIQVADSTAIHQHPFLSRTTIYLKTQYPIQHGMGIEVATPFFFSAHIGGGQLSRLYATSALEFLPQEDDTQLRRKEFIQDNLQNGFVFEFGIQYHILKWRTIYVGLNVQVQQFKVQATPQELVEEYDFGDTQDYLEEITTLVENAPTLTAFYENAELAPRLNAIQIEVKLGKRIHFKKMKNLFLDLELSYQSNLSAPISIQTPSTVGEVLIERFIKPILTEGTDDSFSGFAIPTVGARLSYQIGSKIYHRNGK